MASRRGFTFVELTAACIILAALLAVCLQLLAATAAGRRAGDHRQTAMEEATGALERIYTGNYHQLDTRLARQLAPPDRVRRMLPGGKLQVSVDQPAQTPSAKRIRVAVLWQEGPHDSNRAVHLVAWKYPSRFADRGP